MEEIQERHKMNNGNRLNDMELTIKEEMEREREVKRKEQKECRILRKSKTKKEEEKQEMLRRDEGKMD